MVFRKAPTVLEVNGKTLIPALRNKDLERMGKHIKLSADEIRQRYAPEHRQAALDAVQPTISIDEPLPARELPDPFASMGAITEMDVYERQRIVHDQGGFVDTWLGQLAALATERVWLEGQISDPRWADHPARPDAMKRHESMFAEMADIAESIAYGEAWADRCWQTMTLAERMTVNHMWLTDHNDARLIGRSWKDQARYGWKWPQGCYVDGRWFVGLPDRLYIDLHPLWRDGPTWLGDPVEIDNSAEKAANDELVRHMKSLMN